MASLPAPRPRWGALQATLMRQEQERMAERDARDEALRRGAAASKAERDRLDIEETWSDLYRMITERAPTSKVRRLVEVDPSQVGESIASGDTPFLCSLREGSQPEIVACLLAASPEVASVRDRDGALPLFVALSHGASAEVVRMLMEGHPGAELESTRGMSTALHAGAGGGCGAEVVDLMLSKDSAATRKADDEGNLPLHVAVSHGADASVVRRLVNAYPVALTVGSNVGDTPLHSAVQKWGQATVVDILLTVNPQAAMQRNHEGLTPRHVALKVQHIDSGMISVILKHAPECARVETPQGLHPIEFAFLEKFSVAKRGVIYSQEYLPLETAVALYHAHEEVVHGKYFYHKLAGMGLERDKNLNALEWLITKKPGVLTEKDERGRLVLHRSCMLISQNFDKLSFKHSVGVEELMFLIAKHPMALLVRDDAGKLPADYLIDRHGKESYHVGLTFAKYPKAFCSTEALEKEIARQSGKCKLSKNRKRRPQSMCNDRRHTLESFRSRRTQINSHFIQPKK